ncbi:MAG: SEL1-like repeat protein [Ruminococcus sp.]|nr:SEL1-like repeat protein [Ruminococcus sp.]
METAAEKGCGIAAIYLALHYEHGIGVEKDSAKANSYYSMAQTVDPSVTPIIDIINAVKQKMWFRYDWCTDQDETLAVNLWFNNNEGWNESDVSHCDMVAALDSRLRTDYLRFTTWLLFYYASTDNSVWAKGMLGYALKDYREYVQSNRLYDFLSNETVEDIDKAGFSLLLELWNMSQSGNGFANKFCLDFDIYPRA